LLTAEAYTENLPSVKLPKSFVAINLSEKVPDAFGGKGATEDVNDSQNENADEDGNGNGTSKANASLEWMPQADVSEPPRSTQGE